MENTENIERFEEIEKELKEANMSEDELIKGILAAADYVNDTDLWKEISIVRGEKLLFKFRIRPLTTEEIEYCRERGRKYSNDRGQKKIVDYDENKTRIEAIYKATVDEDRLKVWDNKIVQDKLNVLTGVDVVEQTLRIGEIAAIMEKIDDISGYFVNFDRNEEEIDKIKN